MKGVKDGSEALKYSIKQSNLRLVAAKNGHLLEELAPKHNQIYFLPEKHKYIKKKFAAPQSNAILNKTEDD